MEKRKFKLPSLFVQSRDIREDQLIKESKIEQTIKDQIKEKLEKYEKKYEKKYIDENYKQYRIENCSKIIENKKLCFVLDFDCTLTQIHVHSIIYSQEKNKCGNSQYIYEYAVYSYDNLIKQCMINVFFGKERYKILKTFLMYCKNNNIDVYISSYNQIDIIMKIFYCVDLLQYISAINCIKKKTNFIKLLQEKYEVIIYIDDNLEITQDTENIIIFGNFNKIKLVEEGIGLTNLMLYLLLIISVKSTEEDFNLLSFKQSLPNLLIDLNTDTSSSVIPENFFEDLENQLKYEQSGGVQKYHLNLNGGFL
jgi:hypothetical protein